MELEPGTIINETYALVGPLGRGGMGEVWQARHVRLPKDVALKVLVPSVQDNAEAVARFRREAEITSRLCHPHIVEVLDLNALPDGRLYIAMELLRGENLRQRLARGPLPLSEALTVAHQVASALYVAHRAGVVHRDLKPENIFLCRQPGVLETELQIKVLDFGISKIQGSQTMLTGDSMVLGTPAYMSPEQAAGKNAIVGARADQFALAAITYEMLGGRSPFNGETLPEVIYKVVFETPPSLTSVNPALPTHVVQAIEQGLAKDPQQRFADITAFTSALLGRAVAEETLAAAAVGSAETIAAPTPASAAAPISTATPPSAAARMSTAASAGTAQVATASVHALRWHRPALLALAVLLTLGVGLGLGLSLRTRAPARTAAPSAHPDAHLPHVGVAKRPADGGAPDHVQPEKLVRAQPEKLDHAQPEKLDGGVIAPRKKAPPTKAAPLPPEVSRLMGEANAALAGGKRVPLQLAEQVAAPYRLEVRFLLQALEYCQKGDPAETIAMLRNVRRQAWRLLHRYCPAARQMPLAPNR